MEVLEPPPFVRHRLSVDEYHRMAQTRVLAPDAQVELIDGEGAGVPEVWVLDLSASLLQRYAQPQGDGYADVAVRAKAELHALAVPGLPGQGIDLSALL